MLARAVVLLYRLVVARLDAGGEFKFTLVLRGELHGHDLLTVCAEQNFLLRHRRGAELQPHPRALAAESLRTHAHRHGHLVAHEGHVGCEDVAHDDVTRRGDADAVNVERHALLPEQRGGIARLRAAVVRAVGDEHHAGERLAALAVQHLAQRISQRRKRAGGREFFHPGKVFNLTGRSGVGGHRLRTRQLDDPLPEGEGVEIKITFQAREQIQPGIFQRALHHLNAGDLRHLLGAGTVEVLGQAFGRVQKVFGQRGAFLIRHVQARVFDLHARRVIDEKDERAADAALDGERKNRAEQQAEHEREENKAHRGEQIFARARDDLRRGRVAPPRQNPEHDGREHNPRQPHTAAKGQRGLADAEGIIHRGAEEFEEQFGHARISRNRFSSPEGAQHCSALSGLNQIEIANPGLCPGLSNDALSALCWCAHMFISLC